MDTNEETNDNGENSTENVASAIILPDRDPNDGFWDFSYFKKVLFLFIVGVGKKLTETLISVKVWLLFLVFYYSRLLLLDGKITGDNFTSIITGLLSVIVAMRSLTKISMMVTDKVLQNKK